MDFPDVVEGIFDGVHQLKGKENENKGSEDTKGCGILGEVADVLGNHLLVVLKREKVP
jgi:hypothetical protein